MQNELWRLGVVELAKAIREKQVSSREVVQAHLDRINTVNARLCDAQGYRRILISPSCKNLIKALDGLIYKENSKVLCTLETGKGNRDKTCLRPERRKRRADQCFQTDDMRVVPRTRFRSFYALHRRHQKARQVLLVIARTGRKGSRRCGVTGN